MNRHDDKTNRDGLRALIEYGSQIVGGAAANALSIFAGDPSTALAFGAAGSAVGILFERLGQEISHRLLGPREKVRVGAVFALAASKIKERLDNGDFLRSDGFFNLNAAGQSAASEVAEHVLLKAQREPEEKKLPYMANLLANAAFHDYVSAQMAHQLIKAAEQLTYRQLCILRLGVVKHQFGLRNSDYRGQTSFHNELLQVLYECFDLYQRAFIHFGGPVALGPTDVVPAQMTPQGLGVHLYNLMELAEIPDEDLLPVALQLK